MEPVVKSSRFSVKKTMDGLKMLLDMKESAKNTKKATKSAEYF